MRQCSITKEDISASNWQGKSQFIFDDKLWVIASGSGLPHQIAIYEGSSGDQSNDILEALVVKNALQIFNNPQKCRAFSLITSFQVINCYMT